VTCSPTLRPYRAIPAPYPSLYRVCPFGPENANGYLAKQRDVAQRLSSQTGPGYQPDSPSSRPPHHCHSSPARRHTYPRNIFLYQNCNTTTPTLHSQNNTTAMADTARLPPTTGTPHRAIPHLAHPPSLSIGTAVRRSSLQEVPASARRHHRTKPSILRVECPPCQLMWPSGYTNHVRVPIHS